VAACQPPALAAVISLYSTDNRFQDDIHYKVHILLSSILLYAWRTKIISQAFSGILL
jgi:predicted acyl esterase